MFKTRLISGILLVIVALFAIVSGGDILFGILLVLSLIGMSELYKIADVHKKTAWCDRLCGSSSLLYFAAQSSGGKSAGSICSGPDQ